jgi:hypothetical protein
MIRSLRDYVRRRIGTDLSDIPEWQLEIIHRVMPFTMTSHERVIATIATVEYVLTHNISGAIVECGVWRGGSMMAAALCMLRYSESRPIYLFDTFEGMTRPEVVDVDMHGRSAESEFRRRERQGYGSRWCEASLDEVSFNLESTGFPTRLLHFVKGPVEHTVPGEAPDSIALLRLDTDWYTSTRHELVELYPRVTPFGVVIVDDYGHWRGAKQAVDEYLAENDLRVLLHRIDHTGRMFIKS